MNEGNTATKPAKTLQQGVRGFAPELIEDTTRVVNAAIKLAQSTKPDKEGNFIWEKADSHMGAIKILLNAPGSQSRMELKIWGRSLASQLVFGAIIVNDQIATVTDRSYYDEKEMAIVLEYFAYGPSGRGNMAGESTIAPRQ
jgi:hypothetical protein